MRWFRFLLLPLLLWTEDTDARPSIDSDRPVVSAAETLVKQYRIPVSAEDPVYVVAAIERVTWCGTVVLDCVINLEMLD